MKYNCKILVAIIFLSFIYIYSFSQVYNFKHYNVKSGFPQSNANKIVQDNNGFLWFATQKGLVKFDGKKYTNITEKDGLISNIVQDVFIDSENKLWVSTNKGISILYKKDFTNFNSNNGLKSENVIFTIELPDKTFLINTFEGPYLFKNKLFKKLPYLQINSAFIKNNIVLIASNSGLYKLENGLFIEYNNDIVELKRSFNNVVIDDKCIWLSSDEGIFKLEGKLFSNFNINDGLIDNKINCLLIDSDGILWYGSEGKGLGKYENNKFINFLPVNGFTNTSVLSLFEDFEGNIWIGGRNGASMLNKKTPFVHFSDVVKYDDEIVLGMKEDKYSNIWFSTFGHGISMYDGDKFKEFSAKDGLKDNCFYDIETDKDGNLWFASANAGIVKYDYNKFTYFDEIDNRKIPRVYTVFKDSKNNLWFGTNGMGAIKYDYNKFEIFSCKENIISGRVMGISEDVKGSIWISTINDGLIKFDGKKHRIFNYSTGYKIDFVRCSAKSKNGNLWFGTATDGIFKINDKNDTLLVEYINQETGLSSDNIYLIYFDSNDFLWVGTEKGLDKISFDENQKIKTICKYGSEEGFVGVETNINAVLEDLNGNIWFGTVDGATVYKPKLDKQNFIESKTHIIDINLFFEETDWKLFSDSLDEFNLPIDLELDYNNNHLTFEFAGICFSNPNKVKYKYRLLGQSDIWSPDVFDNHVTFSNITPGNYEFQVISCNDSDLWNTEPSSFKFTINAPFWKRSWFISIIIILIISLTYSIIYFRIKSLQKAKKNLEQKVLERTAEINLQKEEIESQRDEIESQRNIVINQKDQLEYMLHELTDSIKYAKRIQNAILPTNEYINKLIPENFIIFKPRNIVSGDFYWLTELEGKVLIAVVDCTGHGVPGGFMSMLGAAFLNEIINKEYITHPGVILRRLRKEVIHSLQQSGIEGEQKDGMDMSLVSFDKKMLIETGETILQFAGANNPIYLVSNCKSLVDSLEDKSSTHNHLSSLTHTLYELKGDKMPIGFSDKMDRYNNIEIKVTKGDSVYMFSDGFADQFGGLKGKKFKYNQFKNIILENSHFEMSEQAKIYNSIFNSWINHIDPTTGQYYEQIDDIVFFGFRV